MCKLAGAGGERRRRIAAAGAAAGACWAAAAVHCLEATVLPNSTPSEAAAGAADARCGLSWAGMPKTLESLVDSEVEAGAANSLRVQSAAHAGRAAHKRTRLSHSCNVWTIPQDLPMRAYRVT